jgi:hypothetical protein
MTTIKEIQVGEGFVTEDITQRLLTSGLDGCVGLCLIEKIDEKLIRGLAHFHYDGLHKSDVREADPLIKEMFEKFNHPAAYLIYTPFDFNGKDWTNPMADYIWNKTVSIAKKITKNDERETPFGEIVTKDVIITPDRIKVLYCNSRRNLLNNNPYEWMLK